MAKARHSRCAGVAWLLLAILAAGLLESCSFVSTPSPRQLANPQRMPSPEYDAWGTDIYSFPAQRLAADTQGAAIVNDPGAVRIDPKLIDEGRRAFYEETFGNEVFLTDVMGMLDGPLDAEAYSRAIFKLNGRGTSSLQVELSKSATVGGRYFAKGTVIDTGAAVPRGSLLPLGFKITLRPGQKTSVGITCAACHSSVDEATGKVLEGVSNQKLKLGLILALATNSSSYFVHTDVDPAALSKSGRFVAGSNGKKIELPDPRALEDAVDGVLLTWPAGSFDSSVDLVANPTRIPKAFTRGDGPFGWSGFAIAGPFRGLAAFTNGVHAQNSDALANVVMAEPIFGIDKEYYLAVSLQNAPAGKFRYDPSGGERPTDFLARRTPNPGSPGVNQLVKLPMFPRPSPMSPNGMIVSSPGKPFMRQILGMCAFQDTISPPQAPIVKNREKFARGIQVFQKAGCANCHSGSAFTNNRIVPIAHIRTEPTRARSFQKTAATFDWQPKIWPFTAPVPIPPETPPLSVPMDKIDRQQVTLGWALDGAGGYKTPGLLGLYWRAPYLHDGGVAVGADASRQLGMAGTLAKGFDVDPANSLRAMIDRRLRQMVIDANKADPALVRIHIAGIGHEFWVDGEAGFSAEDQDALIHYLLLLE